jgi:hypothetical protein
VRNGEKKTESEKNKFGLRRRDRELVSISSRAGQREGGRRRTGPFLSRAVVVSPGESTGVSGGPSARVKRARARDSARQENTGTGTGGKASK